VRYQHFSITSSSIWLMTMSQQRYNILTHLPVWDYCDLSIYQTVITDDFYWSQQLLKTAVPTAQKAQHISRTRLSITKRSHAWDGGSSGGGDDVLAQLRCYYHPPIRNHMRAVVFAARCISGAPPVVIVSVCLSRLSVVSKRINISSIFFTTG